MHAHVARFRVVDLGLDPLVLVVAVGHGDLAAGGPIRGNLQGDLSDHVDIPRVRIFALGEFREAFEGANNGTDRVARVASVSEAVAGVASNVAEGEVVLVKASRGERLERVVEGLVKKCGEGKN